MHGPLEIWTKTCSAWTPNNNYRCTELKRYLWNNSKTSQNTIYWENISVWHSLSPDTHIPNTVSWHICDTACPQHLSSTTKAGLFTLSSIYLPSSGQYVHVVVLLLKSMRSYHLSWQHNMDTSQFFVMEIKGMWKFKCIQIYTWKLNIF